MVKRRALRTCCILAFAALAPGCDGSFLHGVPAIGAPNDNTCVGVQEPANVAVTVSPAGAALTWAANVSADYVLIVQRRGADGVWGETGRVANDATSYLDDSCVTPNTACAYRLVAASTSCQTVPSQEATAYTLPVAPTGFVAQGDGELAHLSWDGNNLYASEYAIERSDAGGAFVAVQTLDGAAVAHDDPIERNVEYCFRLYAETDAGRGPAAESCTRGGAKSVALTVEPHLAFLRLTWTDDNAFETGFLVRRGGVQIATLGPQGSVDATPFDDTTAEIATTYVYEVVATSATGDSPASTASGTRLVEMISVDVPSVSGCDLTVQVAVPTQQGAVIQSVEAISDPAPIMNTSSAGVSYWATGPIEGGGVGAFEVLWTPTFTNGDSFSATVTHRLSFSSTPTLVQTPVLANGARTKEGMQPWAGPQPVSQCGSAFGRLAQIDAALDHTCARTNLGRLMCWGKGTDGGLGLASSADSAVPYGVCAPNGTSGVGCGGQFLVFTDAIRVAVGNTMSYAVGQFGSVLAWGRRGADPVTQAPFFEDNIDQYDVETLAAADDFACAMTDTLRAVCFGRDDLGQLGRDAGGGSIYRPGAPVCTGPMNPSCTELAPVRSVGAGGKHACAVSSGVWCWGENDRAQVGDGSAGGPEVYAVQVSGAPGTAKQVALGDKFSCGMFDNNVMCWGMRDDGVIGDGNSTLGTNAVAATTVRNEGDTAALGNVVAIAAGARHACALQSNSQVVCWGDNEHGQLGTGDKVDAALPRRVVIDSSATPLVNVAAITAGRAHTCAVLGDASITCWGANDQGQLGNGGIVGDSVWPVPVLCDGLDATCGVRLGKSYRADVMGNGLLQATLQ